MVRPPDRGVMQRRPALQEIALGLDIGARPLSRLGAALEVVWTSPLNVSAAGERVLAFAGIGHDAPGLLARFSERQRRHRAQGDPPALAVDLIPRSRSGTAPVAGTERPVHSNSWCSILPSGSLSLSTCACMRKSHRSLRKDRRNIIPNPGVGGSNPSGRASQFSKPWSARGRYTTNSCRAPVPAPFRLASMIHDARATRSMTTRTSCARASARSSLRRGRCLRAARRRC